MSLIVQNLGDCWTFVKHHRIHRSDILEIFPLAQLV